MRKKMEDLKKDKRGVTAVEYITIITSIFFLITYSLHIVGKNTSTTFCYISKAIGEVKTSCSTDKVNPEFEKTNNSPYEIFYPNAGTLINQLLSDLNKKSAITGIYGLYGQTSTGNIIYGNYTTTMGKISNYSSYNKGLDDGTYQYQVLSSNLYSQNPIYTNDNTGEDFDKSLTDIKYNTMFQVQTADGSVYNIEGADNMASSLADNIFGSGPTDSIVMRIVNSSGQPVELGYADNTGESNLDSTNSGYIKY